MSDKFIPTSQSRGFFDVSAPFTIPPGEIYTCKAVRTISELISAGNDPFVEIYEPKGLDATLYEAHQAEDMEIIYLLNDGGHWEIFPAAYLTGYPNMNGIPYRAVSITVKLPPFPVEQSYEHVASQVKDVVQAALGVIPETDLVVISKTKLVDSDKHKLSKANRIQLSKGTTPSAQAAAWRMAYEDLKIKYDLLAASIP